MDRIGHRQLIARRALECTFQLARRGEVAEQFAGEERTAAALPVHQSRDLVHTCAGCRRGECSDHVGDVDVVEHVEADPGGGGGRAHRGEQLAGRMRWCEVLVAIRGDEEQASVGQFLHEVLQQQQRRRRGPLDVVDHEEHRVQPGESTNERDDGVEQLEPRHRRLDLGMARRAAGEQASERTGSLRHREGERIVECRGLPERHGERVVGDGQVAVAGAREHDRSLGVGDRRRMRDQPRLAEAGRSRDEDERCLTRSSSMPCVGEDAELTLPTDQRQEVLAGEHTRHGRDDTGAQVDHAVHEHRPVESLERPLAELFEHHVGPSVPEHADHVGRQDLARSRHRLEAGGLDHGDAVVVVVVDHDLARSETDAHLERCDGLAAGAVLGDPTLHVDRCGDRIGRRGERGLDAVTGPAQHLATVARDDVGQQVVVVLAEQIGPIVAESGPQLGGTDHVGEQDRTGADGRSHEGRS